MVKPLFSFTPSIFTYSLSDFLFYTTPHWKHTFPLSSTFNFWVLLITICFSFSSLSIFIFTFWGLGATYPAFPGRTPDGFGELYVVLRIKLGCKKSALPTFILLTPPNIFYLSCIDKGGYSSHLCCLFVGLIWGPYSVVLIRCYSMLGVHS